MNKAKYVIIVLIILVFNVTTLFGASVDKEIRVGLESIYKNVNKLAITNNTIEVGYNNYSGFESGGTISSKNGFYLRNSNNYFLKIDENFNSYNEALIKSQAYKNDGYNAGVGYEKGNVWFVIIGELTQQEADSAKVKLSGTILTPREKRAVLFDGNEISLVFESKNYAPQISGIGEDFVNLSGRKYRGRIEIMFTTSDKFTVVNVLSLEEYLYAVVPSEMPSTWHIEALKAQSVAARTYAYSNLEKHFNDGYNVCNDQHCQVYQGVINEITSTTNAVKETSGLVAYYNNDLIDAVFHSSNGGVSASASDVWVADVPYLKEKLDPYDKEGKKWTRTLTLADLDKLLAKNSVSIGKATGVSLDKLSLNGRVLKLSILGTNGTEVLEKEKIRYFFQSDSLPSLESRFFTINSSSGTSSTINSTTTTNYNVTTTDGTKTVNDSLSNFYAQNKNTNGRIDDEKIYVLGKNGVVEYSRSIVNNSVTETTGDTITFTGKGWGHGVGLSQYGAKGMAENGNSFIDILKFYYTGVTIR